MSELVRWGVLGNALIARVCVIPGIQKSENGTVHALASRRPDSARETTDKHRIPHLYDQYDALLADPAIDAVYIPLPNHLHHPWTLKALAAGKHVLVEKPIALNAAQAEEMAAAAHTADRLLMEAFMYRFHPRSRRIKQLVNDGELGDLRFIHAAFSFHLPPQQLKTGANIRLKQEMGGGALLDVGSYGVSVARWLAGAEPVEVSGMATFHAEGVDLQTAVLLRFPNDVLATIQAGFVSALQQTFSVVGTHGAIELPHDAFIPWEKTAVFTRRDQEAESGKQIAIPGADEYALMVTHFAEAVQQGRSLDFALADSINNMRVLDAVGTAVRKKL